MLSKICKEINLYDKCVAVVNESSFKNYIERILINVVADFPPETDNSILVETFKSDLQDLFDMLGKKIVVLYNDYKYREFYNAADVIEAMSSFIYPRINLLKEYAKFITPNKC